MYSTSICSFLELSLLKTDLETDEGAYSEGVTLSHHLNNFSTPFPHPKIILFLGLPFYAIKRIYLQLFKRLNSRNSTNQKHMKEKIVTH